MNSNIRRGITRREFICSSLALTGALPFGALSPSNEELFSVEHVVFPVANLPDAFREFQIAYISDIHLSAFLRSDLLEKVISFIKAREVDLLLLGGDYIWRPREMLRNLFPVYRKDFSDLDSPDLAPTIYRSLIEMLSEIQPRCGTFAVLGNHDRWAASTSCEAAFFGSPIKLLLNESVVISKDNRQLEIIGTDDFLTGQPRFPRSNAVAPDIRILLTHNPDILRWYLGHDRLRFDAAIMGHTHGGQICITPGSPLLLNISDTEFGAGLVLHPSGCYCYTSRGIGCVGVPLRVNCPPEVTLASFSKRS